jgi:hypothetical protein
MRGGSPGRSMLMHRSLGAARIVCAAPAVVNFNNIGQ